MKKVNMCCWAKILPVAVLLLVSQTGFSAELKSYISLKKPGNHAVTYQLKEHNGRLEADQNLPVDIVQSVSKEGDDEIIRVKLTAKNRVYVNFGTEVSTGFDTQDCEFYLPGFWYHRNLRSPKEAPSFHTSKSWNVREDRLSSPLTGVYNEKAGQGMVILRQLDESAEALTTHLEGEVILSGNTSLGYLGFENETGKARLTFGYPYIETPTRYIRKLTLAPAIRSFIKIDKGETKVLTWRIRSLKANRYSNFVESVWQYCFDRLSPQPLQPLFTAEQMKAQLTNYFRYSFVDKYPLKFNSGLTLLTADCKPVAEVQIGFCGRVLLNAFNQLEYGEAHGQNDLVTMGNAIFESFLAHGFSPKGYFHDFVNFREGMPKEDIHSIRQQSEAAYAVFHFLKYEREHGRIHKDWEARMKTLLDNFVALQKADGSFARKYKDNGSDVDASGGSTPSATSTLVMGYKYFGNKAYLKAAKATVDYLEKNIISKSDYFSSTLDANCEDKEAAISAVTATYYLAMVSKGKARQHYITLCKQAAYFAVSWYYLWDVPFAEGQMLGDLGFRSRGWGNVSVENNHVDVFVFEFPHIMKWLGEIAGEPRFTKMYDVIYTSLNQLLPTKERLCGIGVPGYYPEVVQHTTWDYGRNGKGFYNDIFAPGWTIASLWELYSPNRTTDFLK
ncbi:hypothetical protein HMPREF9151_02467 [Hoylesella saccharolytica F0055]|uniref:Glycosyl hydrolase family 9 n=1 Tax=Hoylesella saccharolytica F0055 TaxID=1127699 RepID=L1MYN7_9BACT|nr:hypothetical protein [Hoylesella saccharolytica]EKX96220.1 hypothetical protein HMPREF9151_02467 [Hoylesella saccharolytica F0055]